MEDLLNFLLAACQRAEKEKLTEYKKISESDSEVAENKAFLGTITLLNDSFSKKDNTNIDNNKAEDWKNKFRENKPTSEAWIRSGKSFGTKNKLIQILEGNALIPKQQ